MTPKEAYARLDRLVRSSPPTILDLALMDPVLRERLRSARLDRADQRAAQRAADQRAFAHHTTAVTPGRSP